VPRGAGAAQLLATALPLLVSLAGGGEIDPEELRPDQGEQDRRADGAEDVAHGVGDGHRVEQALGLIARQAQSVDGVGRQPHRRRDRLRACVQARRVAHVVAGQLGGQDGRPQTEHADDDREDRLRQTVLGDTADELRSDAVADRKEEHEEEDRFDVRRDGDADLADQDGGQQRGGDRAQANTADAECADVVADTEREEDRDLRILA
jgi:hypothetical protein